MRRFVLVVSVASAAALAFAGATVVTSAAPQLPGSTAHGFSLTGSTAGGVRSAQSGDPLTFVFSEVNVGSGSPSSEDLVLESLTNASIVSISCVLPSHFLISPDGNNCEPSLLSNGQKASSVINATITAGSRSVTARVCLVSATGVVGPCQSMSVSIV
jgi:hypothetical protein